MARVDVGCYVHGQIDGYEEYRLLVELSYGELTVEALAFVAMRNLCAGQGLTESQKISMQSGIIDRVIEETFTYADRMYFESNISPE